MRLAQEGADIIAVDICKQMEVVGYPIVAAGPRADGRKEVEAPEP